jgi:hypothetical protein
MKQRVTFARVDDVKRCTRIQVVHDAIYLRIYAVDSKAVENLLQGDSLVPTAVCAIFLLAS